MSDGVQLVVTGGKGSGKSTAVAILKQLGHQALELDPTAAEEAAQTGKRAICLVYFPGAAPTWAAAEVVNGSGTCRHDLRLRLAAALARLFPRT